MVQASIDPHSRQGQAFVLRGDARQIPLPDNSVDLIVTSPPYWAQRSYRDNGEHYAGQIGDEDSPAAYIDNLLECVAEWVRVLKPTGSLFVNLNDKYASNPRGPDGSSSRLTSGAQQRPGRSRASSAAAGVPRKSLLLLPERFRIACVDKLGLIARETIIWNKANPMPESATDRCRRSHEDWVHFTKAEHYYSAIDLLRAGASNYSRRPGAKRTAAPGQKRRTMADTCHPLGSLPSSVWNVATQPLTIPGAVAHAACCGGKPAADCQQGLRHFAAFPLAFPARIITGWCPTSVCLSCGDGRRPLVVRNRVADRLGRIQGRAVDALVGAHGPDGRAGSRYISTAQVVGEICACPDASAPTRPAVVLDPMGGVGTTALVAKALGRIGITIDRSGDYCRLATWRTNDPRQLAKAARRPVPPKPEAVNSGQLDLFAGGAA